MIVCSCTQITDTDIEAALVEILSQPNAPLPTPGVVYRHLQARMACCGCAPLAVTTIYEKIDELARKGLACPYACASARGRIEKSVENNPIQSQRLAVIRKLRGIVQGHLVMQEAMALEPERK
jgi:hypothetical protein